MLYKYLIDFMQILVFGKHSHDKRLYNNPNLTLKPVYNKQFLTFCCKIKAI